MRLAPIMQAFFTDYLMTQRQASRHTIASYRDAFKQLLGYARRVARSRGTSTTRPMTGCSTTKRPPSLHYLVS